MQLYESCSIGVKGKKYTVKINDTFNRLTVKVLYCNSPINCTWIPKFEQAKNRRMCHFIEFNGLCMTITDWSKFTGLKRSTIYHRLKKNLPLEEVLKSKCTQ